MNHASEENGPFALCVDTGGYAASLTRWKVYRVVPDRTAERHGQIRVIDESGEDYLYPRECFRPIELSPEIEALFRTSGATSEGS